MFRLKEFRTDNKLKQSDLRNILGCTQPTISQIENGRMPMPTNFIRNARNVGGFFYTPVPEGVNVTFSACTPTFRIR